MPQYSPPPPTLDHLNPIQRYMQKGSLDRQDWIRLGAIILAYFILRPYLKDLAQWWMGPKQGEQVQKDYQERRAKAKVGANTIRGSTKGEDIIEELAEDDQAVATGRNEERSNAINRKQKGTAGVSKSEQEKLLDWDDEPARKTDQNDKGDVMQWLNKWDQ